MKEKKEIITLLDIILNAINGETKDLENIIVVINNERNNIIKKVSELNGQIELLTSILNQSKLKNKSDDKEI